jgi:hypothetical protein
MESKRAKFREAENVVVVVRTGVMENEEMRVCNFNYVLQKIL